MAHVSDAMLARLQAELEEKRIQMDGVVEAAQSEGRDLNDGELEFYNRCKDRMRVIEGQMTPLREGARIALESRARGEELAEAYTLARNPQALTRVEYRTAGEYVADMYHARLGDDDAHKRLEIYNRVAAHQTTVDNPGLIPEQIVSPVYNFVQIARPIVGTIGPVDLGSGAWSYARVTQHTQVGKQSGGEKTELPSRKMLVTKTPLGADTFGGYVNVSKQDINRSSPAILDMVIQDLAEQYAIETEDEAGTVMTAAAAVGPVIPATPNGQAIATAIWGAAGQVFAATKGQGRTVVAVSPDQLGIIGPLFPTINPTNAYSTGFPVANIGQGEQGSISGLTVIMSAGLDTDTILVYSTAAVKAFEYKYGNLQVVEPSVWGVQVGYAGDFDVAVIEPAGIVRVTTA
jgi:HK97 family phage major capsid protein